ncbi:flavin monoamine oxidase family protein [Flavobacterium sp. NPDC079362]|uniref:flavin monoamine oxidase family protein n=1 Tax=Flavobacterium sp. NPDC079362 TaxID=3390566 RepID=UPI003D0247F5
MKQRITILGGGLSGLLIGYRLKKLGFKIQILEARNRLGGRISTVLSANETPVEMGATWFGEQHINLLALLKELGLSYFEQHMKGTAYFEAFSMTPPQSIDIPDDNPSYRIAGGTSSLIKVLAEYFDKEEVYLNQQVKELDFNNDVVMITTDHRSFETDIVISTLPPALLVNSIKFSPSISSELSDIAKSTHTWMQDAIKVALVYKEPFWRNKNISGTLFSNVGPVTEFYDHSNYEVTKYALCGFINSGYSQFSKAERKEKIISQLERLLGSEVLGYVAYEEIIWSEESFTKDKEQGNTFVYPHQNNGNAVFSQDYFNNKFYISGTETSSHFPGYIEGAVFSANKIVSKIVNYL